jgi:peptidoglycan/xylan/chitin deacetylase (PgdA/CDA1 family)
MGQGLEPVAPFHRAIGTFGRVVARVSGPDAEIAAARSGLPDGAALAEAVAVRLLHAGQEATWGPPVVVEDLRSLLELCRARGRASVAVTRADPSLVPELQIGAWFDAPWRTRAMRRAAGGVGYFPERLALRGVRWLKSSADLAFWAGVRERCTPREWLRLTSSSYVALVYHRFAGELKPAQERIDIAPHRFRRQLQALRIARCHPLSPEEVLSFHAGDADWLPPRSFSITVDDAVADCVPMLLRHADSPAQLFVCTRELGGRAHWIAGEPVATWTDVQGLAGAGVAIGSHGRHHRRFAGLTDAALDEELAGSLVDLREHLANSLEVVAFPHGDHDLRVCLAARAAGFRAAYTTQKGRNGAGTDAHCLRRVSVHGHDGALAVLWKVFAGESLPGAWLNLRDRRLAISRWLSGCWSRLNGR